MLLQSSVSRLNTRSEGRGIRFVVSGRRPCRVLRETDLRFSLSLFLFLGLLALRVPRRFIEGLFEDGAGNKGRGRVRRHPVIPWRGGRVSTEFERQLFTCSRATRVDLTSPSPVWSRLGAVDRQCLCAVLAARIQGTRENRRQKTDGWCGEPSPARRSSVSLFAVSGSTALVLRVL